MSEPVNLKSLPRHVAVVMDGNGRWAQQHGHERTYGHQNAIEAVRSTIEGAAELGIQYLTLYTFSTENWNRPKEEVEMLMTLLVQSIHNELEGLMKNQVRLMMTGRMEDLPEVCRQSMQDAIDQTAGNKGLTLVLALSYSGRAEIIDMVRKIARQTVAGELQLDEISEQTVQQNLYHGDVPDPDIMIRTGGDCRISNFLLWQLAYAELFFVPKMWPDFRKQDLFDIVRAFQTRERRFGKTGEQVRMQ
ncbi:MAG: isoprenyl transferase [Bacteroidales bacterium]|nr:isoprenyl transferase [Bacteroidales bacterium]